MYTRKRAGASVCGTRACGQRAKHPEGALMQCWHHLTAPCMHCYICDVTTNAVATQWLIGRDGVFVKHYGGKVLPSRMAADIEALLAQGHAP